MTPGGAHTHFYNLSKCPDMFPTHRHTAEFWEHLGRAIATFGFLEETLAKAYFAFTATKEYSDEKAVENAYKEWLPKLENSLFKPLFTLVEMYAGAVRRHDTCTSIDIDQLEKRIKEAIKIRDALCHGSWRAPDKTGQSALFFVNKSLETFDSRVDINFLKQAQSGTAEIICDVMSSVTLMGFQFPGSSGPGESIL